MSSSGARLGALLSEAGHGDGAQRAAALHTLGDAFNSGKFGVDRALAKAGGYILEFIRRRVPTNQVHTSGGVGATG
jgi:hypothetical protein